MSVSALSAERRFRAHLVDVPERVSRHVRETTAAGGNLAVTREAAGDPGRAIPPMPG